MEPTARARSMRLSLAIALPAALVVASLPAAFATPSAPEGDWYNNWKAIYPNSQAGANVVNGTGVSCQLCHASQYGGQNFNGYGWRVRNFIHSGATVNGGILMAEGLDGDADPTGTTNVEEINGHFQPGWTPGDNNTIYRANLNHYLNQPPPAGILGSLDPCEGVGTETVRRGSPPNPAAFLPGVTSRPLIGATWDPVVDHTTFLPAAVFDFLAVDFGGPVNVSTGWGTLLCNIPPGGQVFSAAAGVPFGLLLPVDCAFVGVSACTQVASFAPGHVQLTNALDIVTGTY